MGGNVSVAAEIDTELKMNSGKNTMFKKTFKLNKLSSALLLIGSSLLLTNQAHATVTVYTDATSLKQNNANHVAYFSQSGLSGEHAKKVPGAGADMMLSLATKIIVPSSWIVVPSGDFNNANVTWRGGISWPQVLRDIAQREGVFINLDWVQKEVHITVPESSRAILPQQTVKVTPATKNTSFDLSGKRASTKGSSPTTKPNTQRLKNSVTGEYETLQAKTWGARKDLENELLSKDAQIEQLLSKQRESQVQNQAFISELNKRNDAFEEEASNLNQLLKESKSESIALKEKYSVIDPSLSSKEAIDATTLFGEHKKRWVLPYDPSFQYFIKGGHADLLEASTPATYIAKTGSVEDVLQQWADALGWHLDYRAKVKHQNPYQVTFKGSFYDSGRDFILMFEDSRRPLNIKFLPDIVAEPGKKGLVIVFDLGFEARN
jgi:hypothetical protein